MWQNNHCGYKAYHLLLAVKVWNLTGQNYPINWLFNIAKEANLHFLHKTRQLHFSDIFIAFRCHAYTVTAIASLSINIFNKQLITDKEQSFRLGIRLEANIFLP